MDTTDLVIFEKEYKNIKCLEISGEIDTSNAFMIQDRILDILKESNNLLIDFSNLQYINSTGIGVLFSMYKKHKANITLIVPDKGFGIRSLLDGVHLGDFLKIKDSVDEV